MPVLRSIRERFREEQPLDGVKVAACLHVTAETANLMQALIAGGAEAALCSANPLTTQDEVAAALVDLGVPVLASRGEDIESYSRHVHALADWKPDITLDDGADLLMLIHERGQEVSGRRRGDHHRPAAPAPARGGGQAGLPGRGGERVAHRAHLQRPLRHRPVGARRDPARHQPAARRPHAGAVRLRRDRQGHRPAGARRRRDRDRLRGRPAARARGAHGRVRGDARARGRRARRPVRHRDRLARRAAARALRANARRRRAGQRRALRRGDRPRRRFASSAERRVSGRCCRSSRSTTWATGGCTCSPAAAW